MLSGADRTRGEEDGTLDLDREGAKKFINRGEEAQWQNKHRA
jgi:hypothetical protein